LGIPKESSSRAIGIIQALGDALAPAEFRDAVLATQAIKHNADFLLR
jgi:hypothetical protein